MRIGAVLRVLRISLLLLLQRVGCCVLEVQRTHAGSQIAIDSSVDDSETIE